MDERFTDRQMALILKQAAELQDAGEEQTHTLESIQEIGRQVGIDPDLIARAAASLPATREGASLLWGESSAYRFSARLPGQLRPSDHADIAAVIRDHLPGAGEVRTLGDGFEWYAGPGDNKMLVTLAPAGQETQLRIDLRQQGPKIGLYLAAGSVTAVAGIAGLIASPVVGAGLLAGVGLASFGGARLAWGKIARRSRGRVAQLVEALRRRGREEGE